MNTPQPEFYCSKAQYTPPWQELYRHQIFIFERHTAFEPSRDLAFLIARWLEKKQHAPQAGYVHRVRFPEQPAMEMLAWTAHQAFHLNEPTDKYPAPKELLLFTSQEELLKWKRDHWKRAGLPRYHAFMVHANCFDQSGQRMRMSRLLTF